MFLELKDGRVINLDKVTLVKSFNAAAALEVDPFKNSLGYREQFMAKHTCFNAKIYLAGSHDSNRGIGYDNLENWQLVRETPKEFLQKANSLLSGFHPG